MNCSITTTNASASSGYKVINTKKHTVKNSEMESNIPC